QLVRTTLEVIRECVERRWVASRAVREGLREQPICEPGVARQQWPVEVRTDHGAGAAALEPAFPVVAEAGQHAAERLGAGIETCSSGMVLEAGERPLLPGLELALDQDVADHPPLACDGLEGEEADA